MSDTLFGRERSGTPVETRGLTNELARFFQSGVQGGFQNVDELRRQAMISILGLDPATIGLEGAVQSGLLEPGDQTAGLFRSMQPFEQRQLAEGSADVREMFSAAGGRFSRSAEDGVSRFQSETRGEFGRNRQQAILNANQQRNQLIAALLQAQMGASQSALDPLALAAQFGSPGPLQFQPGIAGDLLGAGALLFGGGGG